jgi:hypothetical protein
MDGGGLGLIRAGASKVASQKVDLVADDGVK